MPWRENCVDDRWMRWNLLLLVSREHLLVEETHIIKVLIYSPLKTNKRFLNSGTHLTERIMICDKLYAYHILSLVSYHAMNWALATQSSYLDVLNYMIMCQRVHWLVTWHLPETDRVLFRGYSIASGPVCWCLKMTRKEGLLIKDLKFVWFGAVVSFQVWILKFCDAFKCLNCQGSIGFTVLQMLHHDLSR